MELAVHLREIKQKMSAKTMVDRLCRFYSKDLNPDVFAGVFETICRLYAGDEFCFHRLPSADELWRFCRFSQKYNAAVTLLTPPMTDWQLEKCALLFACLEQNCPNAEVVANDPGVLLYVKKYYPGLHLAAGRLFNKGFKDPRVAYTPDDASISAAMHGALRESTFSRRAFLEHLLSIGVGRIEQDILPHVSEISRNDPKMHVGVYFPFGVVTTGRLCQSASQESRGRKKYLIGKKCTSSCLDQTLELAHETFRFRLFQNGNTVYYLYPPAVLTSLLTAGADNSFRMVYQGFAL